MSTFFKILNNKKSKKYRVFDGCLIMEVLRNREYIFIFLVSYKKIVREKSESNLKFESQILKFQIVYFYHYIKVKKDKVEKYDVIG